MKRSVFFVLFFAFAANANECDLSLRANAARTEIHEAQHTARLLGLYLRYSDQHVTSLLAELEQVTALDASAAQNLFDRAEQACRFQLPDLHKVQRSGVNIRARETLAMEPWLYL